MGWGGGDSPRPQAEAPIRIPAWPGCYAIDGWQLTPEGGALHAGERTAVIADVHLGYEWARGSAGDSIPAHSLAETLQDLESLLGRARSSVWSWPATWSRALGLAVERRRKSPDFANGWMTARSRWLRSGESRSGAGADDSAEFRDAAQILTPLVLVEVLTVAGWTIAHGHRPIDGDRSMIGHHHPGPDPGRQQRRCFLAAPGWIMLPAFSRNAAGYDVAAGVTEECSGPDSRCLVSIGVELLDFGPAADLASRIKALGIPTDLALEWRGGPHHSPDRAGA